GPAKPGAGGNEPDEHQRATGDPAPAPGIDASVPLAALDAQLSQQCSLVRLRRHPFAPPAKARNDITAVVNCRSSGRLSTGNDLRHQAARLAELRREQQRVLERVTRPERLALIEQVARQQLIRLGGAPTRQLLGAGALELECRDRLAQLHQRALLVAPQL